MLWNKVPDKNRIGSSSETRKTSKDTARGLVSQRRAGGALYSQHRSALSL